MSNERYLMMYLTMMATFSISSFGLAKADFTFGDVETLPEPINTPGISVGDFTMTADGLEAYFVSINRPGGYGGEDIWICRRESPEDGWDLAVNLGPPVNTSSCDSTPSISADGLELYFSNVGPSGSKYRPGGHGGGDIWVAKRKSRDENWGNPVNLGTTINSSSMETYPHISADGLSLYFSNGDILVATRAGKDDGWGSPVSVTGGVNSGSWEGFPSLSADQRVLFFYSDRPGGYGGMDMYMSMRATVFDAWGPAINLGPMINTPYYDISPSLSPDGCTLYFAHNYTNGWGGHFKIYRTTISPVVDFNGDGIVDAADICIMVEYWGTDEPLCDTGPYAWGDGVVDFEDLKVLAGYIGKEVEDPTLAAHWPLDETEGMLAADGAGENDGVVMGNATWQPDGGVVGGALECDGVDDFLVISPIAGLGDGPFSILAWIKGGQPGQVIICQQAGANWAMTNPLDGSVMTELTAPGRNGRPLFSDVVITDGQWHRVGLVWDGTHRILLVDEQEVARDEQAELDISDGGLFIGTGVAPLPGTYFSGLIDDVRIYNRAVKP